jgi:hypothetical protein
MQRNECKEILAKNSLQLYRDRMNSYLSSELATSLHREMIGRRDQARLAAAASRQRRAQRLTRRAATLTQRAAHLVGRTHA